MNKFFSPPSPHVKLLSIAAFYKNDSEGGIGLIVPDDIIEFTIDLVLNMLEGWEADWLAADVMGQNKLYAHAIGQLEHWGSSGIWKTQSEGVLSIANIGFLERHDKLQSDNYNGLMLKWELNKK